MCAGQPCISNINMFLFDSHQLVVFNGRFFFMLILINQICVLSGVTSTTEYIRIRFNWKKPKAWPNCHLLRECIKFTLMVDSGPCEFIKNYSLTSS